MDRVSSESKEATPSQVVPPTQDIHMENNSNPTPKGGEAQENNKSEIGSNSPSERDRPYILKMHGTWTPRASVTHRKGMRSKLIQRRTISFGGEEHRIIDWRESPTKTREGDCRKVLDEDPDLIALEKKMVFSSSSEKKDPKKKNFDNSISKIQEITHSSQRAFTVNEAMLQEVCQQLELSVRCQTEDNNGKVVVRGNHLKKKTSTTKHLLPFTPIRTISNEKKNQKPLSIDVAGSDYSSEERLSELDTKNSKLIDELTAAIESIAASDSPRAEKHRSIKAAITGALATSLANEGIIVSSKGLSPQANSRASSDYLAPRTLSLEDDIVGDEEVESLLSIANNNSFDYKYDNALRRAVSNYITINVSYLMNSQRESNKRFNTPNVPGSKRAPSDGGDGANKKDADSDQNSDLEALLSSRSMRTLERQMKDLIRAQEKRMQKESSAKKNISHREEKERPSKDAVYEAVNEAFKQVKEESRRDVNFLPSVISPVNNIKRKPTGGRVLRKPVESSSSESEESDTSSSSDDSSDSSSSDSSSEEEYKKKKKTTYPDSGCNTSNAILSQMMDRPDVACVIMVVKKDEGNDKEKRKEMKKEGRRKLKEKEKKKQKKKEKEKRKEEKRRKKEKKNLKKLNNSEDQEDRIQAFLNNIHKEEASNVDAQPKRKKGDVLFNPNVFTPKNKIRRKPTGYVFGLPPSDSEDEVNDTKKVIQKLSKRAAREFENQMRMHGDAPIKKQSIREAFNDAVGQAIGHLKKKGNVNFNQLTKSPKNKIRRKPTGYVFDIPDDNSDQEETAPNVIEAVSQRVINNLERNLLSTNESKESKRQSIRETITNALGEAIQKIKKGNVNFGNALKSPKNKIRRKPTGYAFDLPPTSDEEDNTSPAEFFQSVSQRAAKLLERKVFSQREGVKPQSMREAMQEAIGEAIEHVKRKNKGNVNFNEAVKSPKNKIKRKPTGYAFGLPPSSDEEDEPSQSNIQALSNRAAKMLEMHLIAQNPDLMGEEHRQSIREAVQSAIGGVVKGIKKKENAKFSDLLKSPKNKIKRKATGYVFEQRASSDEEEGVQSLYKMFSNRAVMSPGTNQVEMNGGTSNTQSMRDAIKEVVGDASDYIRKKESVNFSTTVKTPQNKIKRNPTGFAFRVPSSSDESAEEKPERTVEKGLDKDSKRRVSGRTAVGGSLGDAFKKIKKRGNVNFNGTTKSPKNHIKRKATGYAFATPFSSSEDENNNTEEFFQSVSKRATEVLEKQMLSQRGVDDSNRHSIREAVNEAVGDAINTLRKKNKGNVNFNGSVKSPMNKIRRKPTGYAFGLPQSSDEEDDPQHNINNLSNRAAQVIEHHLLSQRGNTDNEDRRQSIREAVSAAIGDAVQQVKSSKNNVNFNGLVKSPKNKIKRKPTGYAFGPPLSSDEDDDSQHIEAISNRAAKVLERHLMAEKDNADMNDYRGSMQDTVSAVIGDAVEQIKNKVAVNFNKDVRSPENKIKRKATGYVFGKIETDEDDIKDPSPHQNPAESIQESRQVLHGPIDMDFHSYSLPDSPDETFYEHFGYFGTPKNRKKLSKTYGNSYEGSSDDEPSPPPYHQNYYIHADDSRSSEPDYESTRKFFESYPGAVNDLLEGKVDVKQFYKPKKKKSESYMRPIIIRKRIGDNEDDVIPIGFGPMDTQSMHSHQSDEHSVRSFKRTLRHALASAVDTLLVDANANNAGYLKRYNEAHTGSDNESPGHYRRLDVSAADARGGWNMVDDYDD